jgi:hypothetical protein
MWLRCGCWDRRRSVGDGDVVAVVDGEMRLEHPVQAGVRRELAICQRHLLDERSNSGFGGMARVELRSAAYLGRRPPPRRLGQPLTEPVVVHGVVIAVLAKVNLHFMFADVEAHMARRSCTPFRRSGSG